MSPLSMPAIAAHRGWHEDGAPKNSIAALEAAAARPGVQQVEIDVRRLGDETMVVVHDPAIDGRPLASMRFADLAHYPNVPTLEQWSRRAGELGIGALVELKETGYEAAALDVVHRFVPAERIDAFSFHHAAVVAMRAERPTMPVGLLTVGPTDGSALDGARLVDEARSVDATFVGVPTTQASDDVLEAASTAGLGVTVWPNGPDERLEQLIADPRVTTVITDQPAESIAQRTLAFGSGAADGSIAVRLLRTAGAMR